LSHEGDEVITLLIRKGSLMIIGDSAVCAITSLLLSWLGVQTSAAEYLKEGKLAFEQAKFDVAIRQFSEAIRLDPLTSEAFCYRGRCFAMSFRTTKEALNDFNEAIRLNAKYADAYRERGWVYSLQGKTEEALEDLTQAIKLRDKDYRALFKRGSVLY